MSLEVEKLGKYKIVSKVGAGAMGEVYKAHDPILNRYVAIKTMSASLGADNELVQRFLREAQSAARLNHPYIITVFDFGEEQGKFYMAMELLEGTDLKEVINRHQLTTLEDKLTIMEQIAEGLAFAHQMEVVHRDLKPANIHIQPNGQIKIMDFGLAKLGKSDMTRTGMVMGTPNYMSPEQVRGQRADARSDIFSLGAVYYEILCSRKAFDAESLHAVLFQVMEHEPESVRNWMPEVPNVLTQIIEKCLAKNNEERFQNAAELREALRQVRRLLNGEIDEDDAFGLIFGEEARDEEPEAPADDRDPLATLIGHDDTEATRMEPATPIPGRVEGSVALDPARKSPSTLVKGGTVVKPKSNPPTPATHIGTNKPKSSPPSRISGPGTRIGSGPKVGATVMGQRPARRSSPNVAAEEEAPPPPPAASKMPLIAGGALAVVGLLTAGILMMRPAPQPAPPPATQAGNDSAVAQVLVGTQVELARKNLEYKDWKGALGAAEQVLKLDPNNDQAKQIREKAQGALGELDAAAAEARQSAQSGDFEKAGQALEKVMSLDPNHPVAAELGSQLNSRFRGQADDARRSMRRAAQDAERAKASSLDAFEKGQGLAREAEDLFLKNQYTAAMQKFLESRDAYDRARQDAEAARAAARTPPPATAAVTPVTAPPATAPPPTQVAATLPPPPTAPPATAPPVTAPPPTAPAATAAANPEPVVRKVIADYAHALESKDLALFRRIKPNLTADEEKKLQASFAAIKAQQVKIDVTSVQIDGGSAKVRVTRSGTVNGQSVPTIQQVFTLSRSGETWTIVSIGQ